MIKGRLGNLVIRIDFEAFEQFDHQYFQTYFACWLKKVNQPRPGCNEAYRHLLDVVMKNTLALNEHSTTIASKWLKLLRENEQWNMFFNELPFTLSTDKVLYDLIILRDE